MLRIRIPQLSPNVSAITSCRIASGHNRIIATQRSKCMRLNGTANGCSFEADLLLPPPCMTTCVFLKDKKTCEGNLTPQVPYSIGISWLTRKRLQVTIALMVMRTSGRDLKSPSH